MSNLIILEDERKHIRKLYNLNEEDCLSPDEAINEIPSDITEMYNEDADTFVDNVSTAYGLDDKDKQSLGVMFNSIVKESYKNKNIRRGTLKLSKNHARKMRRRMIKGRKPSFMQNADWGMVLKSSGLLTVASIASAGTMLAPALIALAGVMALLYLAHKLKETCW